MKKYALIAGSLLALFPFGHGLRGIEHIVDVIPIFVLWFTFCVSFVVYILDDYHNHGTQTLKRRFKTNDAYTSKLFHITLGYQILFHILLLTSLPVFEALAAFTVFTYFLYRFQEV
jgi:hypothetical protein